MISTFIFCITFFILISIIGVIIGHYRNEDLNNVDTTGGLLVFIGLVGITMFMTFFFLCVFD